MIAFAELEEPIIFPVHPALGRKLMSLAWTIPRLSSGQARNPQPVPNSQGQIQIMTEQAVESTRKKTRFSNDVLKLVSGTAIAQLLSILASPILTRLYAPEAFGTLALLTSITSILGVIACLRYELAIVLPENDEDAANLLAVSLGIPAFISLLTVPAFWLAGPLLAQWLNAPELNRYLWLVPPVLLFGGIGIGHPALNYWANRTRRFKELSITRVIGTTTTVGCQLGAGLVSSASTGGLIGASIIGSVVSPLMLAWQIWRANKKLFLRSISWRAMVAGIKRYRRFPFYSTWSALMNTISWQLPIFLLSAYFSPYVVGLYALGNRVLRVPMNFVGNSIGQVFFQRAAQAKNEGTLAPLVESVFRQLVNFGLFPSLLLSVIGKDVFAVVFGNSWSEAGIYAQILSIWTFFWFISSPLSTLFSVLERQDIELYINIAIIISRLLSLVVGGYLGNARVALMLYSGTGILVYGFLSYIILKMSGVSWKSITKILIAKMVVSLPVVGIVFFLVFVGISEWMIILAACVLSAIYYFWIIKTDPQLYQLTKHVLSKIPSPIMR